MSPCESSGRSAGLDSGVYVPKMSRTEATRIFVPLLADERASEYVGRAASVGGHAAGASPGRLDMEEIERGYPCLGKRNYSACEEEAGYHQRLASTSFGELSRCVGEGVSCHLRVCSAGWAGFGVAIGTCTWCVKYLAACDARPQ